MRQRRWLRKGKLEKTKDKGLTKIDDKCTGQAGVLDQYPGDDPANTIEFIDDMLVNRADLVLGESNLGCDEVKVDCFKTISKQRVGLADKMLNSVLKCMKDVTPGDPLDLDCLKLGTCDGDKTVRCDRDQDCTDALTTGPCEKGLLGQIAKVEGKITDACGAITGAEVGSCSPLPSCVSATAMAEGREAGTRAYPNQNCGDTPTADARTASIDIDTPTDLGGLTIEVKYPRLAMGLPDNGDIGLGDLSNFTVSFISTFDLDGVLRISAADFFPIQSGQFVDVSFDTCFPLVLGSCDIGGAPCDDDVDCGANGPCKVENGLCSYSEFINCGDSPLPGCPTGETCSAQQNLASCTVVAASDTFSNPVDGVTCSVTLSEP